MKNLYKLLVLPLAVAVFVTSCNDDVVKWEEWPSWSSSNNLTVNGQLFNEDVYSGLKSTTVKLTAGQEVKFNGLLDINTSLQPEFFTVTGEQTAIFNGITGDYRLSCDMTRELIYVQMPDAEYPDCVYYCGRDFGHPGAGENTANNWKWDSPANCIYVQRQPDANVYKMTVYMTNPGFKFFKQMSRANEITTKDVTILNTFLIEPQGDFLTGPLFKPGRYELILDMDAKTFDCKPLDFEIHIPEYSINDVKLTPQADAGSMLGVRLQLHKGDEVTFTDLGDVSGMLQPDWFSDATATTATFVGEDGEYGIYYDGDNSLIYVADRTLSYPDALWLFGEGIGHPRAGKVTAGSWSWSKASDAIQARRVADGVYEATVYLADGFRWKFFKQLGWGGEVTALTHTPMPEVLIGSYLAKDNTTGSGHFTGDYYGTADFKAGVYTLRVDDNKGVCVIVDEVDVDKIDGRRMINGTEFKAMESFFGSMSDLDKERYAGFVGIDLNLTTGQEMTFNRIANLEYALHPDLFKIDGDKITFKAPSGLYRLMYKEDKGIVYGEPVNDDSNTYWAIGVGLGHPCQSLAQLETSKPYGSNNEWPWWWPTGRFALYNDGNGTYTGTVFLAQDSYFAIFKEHKWGNDRYYPGTTKVINAKGETVDTGQSDNYGFEHAGGPGTYIISLDTKTNTVTFNKFIR